jgi:hypothetical protein
MQDEANSQGVIAKFGNPNSEFTDGLETCMILRLEDAPDPIAEDDLKTCDVIVCLVGGIFLGDSGSAKSL